MLHQVGVSFVLYYDARKHKIKILRILSLHMASKTSVQIAIKLTKRTPTYGQMEQRRGLSLLLLHEIV